MASPGLIFPGAATLARGAVLEQGLCIFRGDQDSMSSDLKPLTWLLEMREFLCMTPENITKMTLANSISLQIPLQMKCPEIKTLKHLKVSRMLINSDDLYVLIIH